MKLKLLSRITDSIPLSFRAWKVGLMFVFMVGMKAYFALEDSIAVRRVEWSERSA